MYSFLIKHKVTISFIVIILSLSTDNAIAFEKKTVTLSSGYRRDNFSWSIAGDINGNNPNIISELKWDDLEIFQFKVEGNVVLDNNIFLHSSFDYGNIFSGKNQDSDYLGDNRTSEYSRSNNNADDGNVHGFTFGIGYNYNSIPEKVSISPILGYSYYVQNLVITDGVQTLNSPQNPVPLGPIPGLNSTYNTQWKGLWSGVNLYLNVITNLSISTDFEYHWSDYNANADWNLSSTFEHPKSFAHSSNGHGMIFRSTINYKLYKTLSIIGTLEHFNWTTDAGITSFFLSNGSIAKQQLNTVHWDSFAVRAGISYSF